MSRRSDHAGSRGRGQRGGWGEPVGRRYEIRPAGLLYVGVTLFIAIGAVNSQNNLLFWLFGMAVGAIVVSGLVSGSAMMGLRARRFTPSTIEAGADHRIGYELRHRGRRSPAFALLMREVGARGDAGVGRVEVGYAHVVHLAPGASTWAWARVAAIKRGGVRLDWFEVSTTFPFGLFRKSVIFRDPGELVVTPPRIDLSESVIESASSAGGVGAPRATRPGLSDEFYGLRAYVPGDSPRLISWKRSAALGDLVVRQTASPTPPRVVVALSRDAGEADDGEAELAVALAASLAATACARGFLVAVDAPWAGLSTPMGGGAYHAARCVRELGLLDLGARVGIMPLPRRGAAGRIVVTTHAPEPDPEHPGALVLSTASPEVWLAGGAALPEALRAASPARRGGRPARNAGAARPVKGAA